MPFSPKKAEDRKVKQVLSGGQYQWEGSDIRKAVGGEYGGIILYSCMKMEK
jgi:hypothetical protein